MRSTCKVTSHKERAYHQLSTERRALCQRSSSGSDLLYSASGSHYLALLHLALAICSSILTIFVILQIPLGLLLVFAIIVLPSALATEIVPEKDNEQLIAETLPANQISRGIDALVAKVRKDHQASEPQPAPAVDLESAADEIILLEKVVPESILLHLRCCSLSSLLAN